MLRLHTLGSFELLEGEPPAVRLIPTQPKRLALLAYLALAQPRGAHRRDTLLALFWPELSAEEARRALRQALHHLRRAVGEAAIETRADDQVRFQEGTLWCDALAFQAAVAEGRPDEALGLYRNGFLAGVHLPDVSVELEEWIEQTRTRLQATAGEAAAALSGRAEERATSPEPSNPHGSPPISIVTTKPAPAGSCNSSTAGVTVPVRSRSTSASPAG